MAVARATPPVEVLLEVFWPATRSPLLEVEALVSEEEEPLLVAVVMVESVLVIDIMEDEALSEDMVIEAMEEDMSVEPNRWGQLELSCAVIRYTNPKMGGRTCRW